MTSLPSGTSNADCQWCHGEPLAPTDGPSGELMPRVCGACTPAPCIGGNPACPCQDGDPCHYEDDGDTKAFPAP